MKETLSRFLDRAGEGPVIVSACLIGMRTRYDACSKGDAILIEYARGHRVIPVCPEQLGGLPTPRPRSSIVATAPTGATGEHVDGRDVLEGRARVISEDGRDVTDNFLRGAREVAALAEVVGARFAVLKEKSPSCGAAKTSREFHLADGSGVTAALLMAMGVEIFVIE